MERAGKRKFCFGEIGRKKGMWECGVIVFQLKYFNQIEVVGFFMAHNHITDSRSVYYTGYAKRAFCGRTRVLTISS